MSRPPLSPAGASVRRNDPDRFLTALFAPPEFRETLFLLFAFNHELARAREVASEPTLALMRLQWWREVVQGEPRRHELATPLAEALGAGRIERADLLTMIEAREIEAELSVETRAQWLGYVADCAGTLAAAAGRALGADGPTLSRLRALGAAYGVAGLLRDVGRKARQGRCLLPEDVLHAHGLTTHDVVAAPERAASVLPELAMHGAAWCREGAGSYPAAVRAAALVGMFARGDLARIACGGPTRRTLADRFRVTLAAFGWPIAPPRALSAPDRIAHAG